MIPENQLRVLIAGILGADPDKVQRETSLKSLDNSLGEAKLRSGLKRLNLQLPIRSRPITFGELYDLLSGTTPSEQAAPMTFPALLTDLHVGLDVQEIGELPQSNDYWEDAFYQGHFDKSEIAYALIQPEPRIHFAGFWCAKEALRKCDRGFAHISPALTFVAHEDNGSPYFLWNNSGKNTRLRHALSISHTGSIAMAIVIAGRGEANQG